MDAETPTLPTGKPPANPIVSAFRALWDEKQAADYLMLMPRTLRNWRSKGFGPLFVKMGNQVRYKKDLLDVWIDEQTRDPAT